MAVGPASIWHVRVSGSNVNGGGYDATIASAGADLSDQDAAALTLTDIACAAGVTVTSATGGFTSAMIGNTIWLVGGGATVGAYFIITVASTNSITVDRAPAVITAGNGKVGGAWADPKTNCQNSPKYVAAGNTIFIRGAGTDTPTTPDYTFAGYYTPANGDGTNGWVKVIGYNGRPMLRNSTDLLLWSAPSINYFENLYLRGTDAGVNTQGMCQGNSGTAKMFVNVVFDQLGIDGPLIGFLGATFVNCEFFSSSGGSGGTSYIINESNDANNYGSGPYLNCNIHNATGHGIKLYRGSKMIGCIVAKCNGDGITSDSAEGRWTNSILNCTIDGNTGNGIVSNTSADLSALLIVNNTISNHNQAAKSGILSIGPASAAAAARIALLEKNNNFFNNTANATNLTLDASDTTLNPQYVAQATQDYKIGTNLKALGFPLTAMNQHSAGQTAVRTFIDIGGAQRQEAGGGSGGGLKLAGRGGLAG